MSSFDALVTKLREIFQIDRPELDFGVYRILNARAGEIDTYLTTRLKQQVADVFDAGAAADTDSLARELTEKTAQYEKDGVDPDAVPRIKELRAALTAASTGASEHENQVYSHLLTFFSRYYDKGDFISQRRYKGDTYAIPYAGEEVVLHWANKDQYYTKSGEAFSNYGFKLEDARTVQFRLVAADTAKDNRKDNDKERRFILAEARTVERVDEDGEAYEELIVPITEEDGNLVIHFDYKAMPKGTKQDVLVDKAVTAVLADERVKARWLALTERAPTDKNPQRTLLEKCLTNYTQKNTADYFIHKNLGGFLRRELDFYIKNEVMNLDDVQNAAAFGAIEKNLRMIQCLREIALHLITFLASIEDFQKKLWLKKKFVVSAHYCVTLDRVPEELYPTIAANPAQWAQWHELGMRVSAQAGSIDDLKASPYLMVDTALFDAAFRANLLKDIPDLDASTDGLLVHGDNFQALTLLTERYRGCVKATYIDPPYNTDASAINYKNGYKSSSWACLLQSRLAAGVPLLRSDGVLMAAIDDVQFRELSYICQDIFAGNLLGTFSVRANPSGRPTQTGYSISHEYLIAAGASAQATIGRLPPTPEQAARFNQSDSEGPFEWRNLRREGSNSDRNARPRLYYPIYVTADAFRVPQLDWDNDTTSWAPKEEPEGVEEIAYPTNDDGVEKTWRWEAETVRNSAGQIAIRQDRSGRNYPYIKRRPNEDGVVSVSTWNDAKYSATEHGTALIKDLFGSSMFSYPKSIHAVRDAIFISGCNKKDGLALDYFGGSGTTAHAVIDLNRKDEGSRRYIIVEQGEYFDSVLKPRVQKVVYSQDWEDGHPTSQQAGISHAFKVLKLESYEDTLNNLNLKRDERQGALLDAVSDQARDDYLMRYMLDVEARGSLLSVGDFHKPFDYTLNIAVDSAGAYESRKVDLVETFNYLIGLTVRHVDIQLKQGFVTVEGTLPTGEKTLILWRDCDVLDYEGLTRLCEKLAINPADSEYEVVYINGDHNIPSVLTTSEAEGEVTKALKLRQIEPAFLSAMFDVADVLMARAPRVKRTFHQELVLNRWMLSHFKGGSLAALKERLGEDRHEGIDDDGQTRFFHELTRNLFNMDRISEAELRRYDLNIVRHWQAITHRRNAADGVILTLKYFQYLSLLFSEIYLDWYFKRRQQLLDGLNEQMAAYRLEPGAENFRDYTADDLNKLAFWNATGSGKTLLLHVNIHQYLHYFQAGKTNIWPDRIILLTPNEGLSRQHLEEFRLSGINAHLFDKNQSDSLYKGWIDVIEVTKLAEEMGDKTVATGAFEGNNLVLVDEGHRGAGTAGGVWMARRAALVRGGFAFEYSATFSQSVAKGATVEKAEQDILKAKAKRLFDTTYARLDASQQAQIALTPTERAKARTEGVREAYAKAVLIDYSYKYFYADGYGKESLILNLDDAGYDKHGALYFTACLLSFYQQLWLWDTHRDRISEFNIEKPLWVFVGNTVSGENSDVLAVLEFLASFLNDDAQAIEWIADLIANKARLLDPRRNDVFAGRFSPLMQRSAETIYADILRRLFNADARQRLKLVNLKGSKGELALRVGTAPYFGLINIGDDAGFFKSAEDAEDFDTESDEFGDGLFGTINLEGSKLNVLIGSRKFTEGWSSWRVSTMGLLNMGQGEGSQIIQLFGRGVRLKGKGMSLKRSLPHERPKGVHLERLETLNIFGVRANYMAAFKDYLKEEGITPSDEIIELDFPTRSNLPTDQRLKTLKLKDGYKDNQLKGFKRSHFPWLYEIPADFVGKVKAPHATLDLYPRIEALSTKETTTAKVAPDARHKGKLASAAMAMFDWDAIFLAIQEYKLLKAWSNLRLDRQRLIDFCTGSNSWYTLFIPQTELALNDFADVAKQQGILVQLLTEYTDRFYQTLKAGYEGQFYDVAYISDDHGSMLKLYQFEIDGTDNGLEYQAKLETLRDLVAAGKIGEASQWNAPHMVAISFARHLYYPLMAPEFGGTVPLKMRPLAFDSPSEVQFVRDLEAYYNSPAAKGVLSGRSLYLLRNADSQAKGVGFARAGNFYPDFLLWVVDDDSGQQWLSFVDPKGIRNLDLNDPKLGLYSEIKEREKELNDPDLILNAFILSYTAHQDLLNVGTAGTKADLEARHVLFMNDGREAYLGKLFDRMVA